MSKCEHQTKSFFEFSKNIIFKQVHLSGEVKKFLFCFKNVMYATFYVQVSYKIKKEL